MSVEPEHWFDRLAAPHTRRQGLRAALATAALTLPFLRSGPARAANPNARGPNDCLTGCFYTSHIQFARRKDNCQSGALLGTLQGGATFMLFAGVPFAFAQSGAALIMRTTCYDQALLRQKAMQYDCLKPDCPGFDPEGPDGPCEPCALLRTTGQNCVCCPDHGGTLLGYAYCSRCNPETGSGCG